MVTHTSSIQKPKHRIQVKFYKDVKAATEWHYVCSLLRKMRLMKAETAYVSEGYKSSSHIPTYFSLRVLRAILLKTRVLSP